MEKSIKHRKVFQLVGVALLCIYGLTASYGGLYWGWHGFFTSTGFAAMIVAIVVNTYLQVAKH